MVATFDRLTAWMNNIGIEWSMSQSIQVNHGLFFDNLQTSISCLVFNQNAELNPYYLRPTFYNIENGSAIINSLIIGNSNETDTVMMPSTAGLTGNYFQLIKYTST